MIRLRIRSATRKSQSKAKAGDRTERILERMSYGKHDMHSNAIEGYTPRARCQTEVWRREDS